LVSPSQWVLILQPGTPVLAVTKGLEDQPDGDLWTLPVVTNSLLPESFARPHQPERHRGAMHLPRAGCPPPHVCGFLRRATYPPEALRRMFATSYYHIWLSTDVTGVEVCAALKNGYALGVGLAVGLMEKAGPDGLAHMYNPKLLCSLRVVAR